MSSSTSILIHKEKILFILRDNKPEIHEPNTWQLPGGGVESGEDHLLAIQRELMEEINIIPAQLKYLGSALDDTKVFFAFLSDEEVKKIKLGNEGQKLEFFSFKEALKQNLTKKLRMHFEKFSSAIIDLVNHGSIDDISRLGLTA